MCEIGGRGRAAPHGGRRRKVMRASRFLALPNIHSTRQATLQLRSTALPESGYSSLCVALSWRRGLTAPPSLVIW